MVMLSLAASFLLKGEMGLECDALVIRPASSAPVFIAPRWSVTCGGVCEETEGQSDKKDVTVLKKEEKQ